MAEKRVPELECCATCRWWWPEPGKAEGWQDAERGTCSLTITDYHGPQREETPIYPTPVVPVRWVNGNALRTPRWFACNLQEHQPPPPPPPVAIGLDEPEMPSRPGARPLLERLAFLGLLMLVVAELCIILVKWWAG